MRVFLGYDHVESVAYHVCSNSIQRRASQPVAIAPIMLSQLQAWYRRPRDPRQSNDFSFARFLVPFLCGFKGTAIFMDSDFLCLTDIHKIMDDVDLNNVVTVVKHDYTPVDEIKYLGNKQYKYPRKNWSSMMVFNCEKCATLTTDYVNRATPSELHQLKWADSIGELSTDWNHLVGEYEPNPKAKLVHYTRGLPLWPEYMGCEYSREWWQEFDDTIHWDKNVIYTHAIERPGK